MRNKKLFPRDWGTNATNRGTKGKDGIASSGRKQFSLSATYRNTPTPKVRIVDEGEGRLGRRHLKPRLVSGDKRMHRFGLGRTFKKKTQRRVLAWCCPTEESGQTHNQPKLVGGKVIVSRGMGRSTAKLTGGCSPDSNQRGKNETVREVSKSNFDTTQPFPSSRQLTKKIL